MTDKDRSLFSPHELKLLDRVNNRAERKKAAVVQDRVPGAKAGAAVVTQNHTTVINATGAGPDLVRQIDQRVKAANEKAARDLKAALAGGGG